jgi:hypothetical protein
MRSFDFLGSGSKDIHVLIRNGLTIVPTKDFGLKDGVYRWNWRDRVLRGVLCGYR